MNQRYVRNSAAKAVDKLEQGAFTGCVQPEKPENHPGLYCQINVAQRGSGIVIKTEVTNRKHVPFPASLLSVSTLNGFPEAGAAEGT